jgi:transposase
VAATPASPVGSWSSEAKFAAVVETARLNELELGEYCRHKGLFAEQIGVWRETCRQANAALPTKAERAQRRAEREQVQYLTRELQRKDRALAEAAALLVLQKNSGRSGRSPRTFPSPGAAGRGECGHRPGGCRRGPPGAGLRGGGAEPAHAPALASGGRPQDRWAPPRASPGGRPAHPGQPPFLGGTRPDPGGGQHGAVRPLKPPPDRPSPGPDQGRYLASEATFYRVLRAADQHGRRGRVKGPGAPNAAGGHWPQPGVELGHPRSSAGRSTPKSPPRTLQPSSTRPTCAKALAPRRSSCTPTTVRP